jgi:molybdate transport system regulatory protein
VSETKSRLHLRIRLLCGDEIAMGPGKADLLEAIEKEGSISAAGRALGMSYRRAWLLVDTMNRCWRSPLVEATAGGSQDRGARLTELGREVLEKYRKLLVRVEKAAHSDELTALTASLRRSPRATQTE